MQDRTGDREASDISRSPAPFTAIGLGHATDALGTAHAWADGQRGHAWRVQAGLIGSQWPVPCAVVHAVASKCLRPGMRLADPRLAWSNSRSRFLLCGRMKMNLTWFVVSSFNLGASCPALCRFLLRIGIFVHLSVRVAALDRTPSRMLTYSWRACGNCSGNADRVHEVKLSRPFSACDLRDGVAGKLERPGYGVTV